MDNLTDNELELLKIILIHHIGYISELVSKTKEDIENIKDVDATLLFKKDSDKDLYLEQLKDSYDQLSKDLDEYKNIYSKISNLKKETINNE